MDAVGRNDGESRSLFRGIETSSAVLGIRRRRISGEARDVEWEEECFAEGDGAAGETKDYNEKEKGEEEVS